jgi:heat shock protein HslJ
MSTASASMAAAGFRAAAIALACAGCTTIAVGPRSLEGTHWQVIGIDRAPIRKEAGYRMDFDRGRFSGGFGCNGMSAEYRVADDQLLIGKTDSGRFHIGWVTATERDCSMKPDGHFEGDALAVLQRPMTLRFRDGRHAVLSNASGSIDLVLIR